MSKVLVIAAHPDDEVLGVGGTIAKRVADGDVVRVLCVTGGETSGGYNRWSETGEVAEILGIESYVFTNLADQKLDTIAQSELNNIILGVVEQFSPDVVYTHACEDLNIDHRIVHDSAMVACRPHSSTVRELYTFNVSAWDFGEMGSFKPNTFVDVHAHFDKKLMAIQCYRSELKGYPHPVSIDGIRADATVKGVKFGLICVEEFKQVYRVL